jgi:flagellar motor switch protein FliM
MVDQFLSQDEVDALLGDNVQPTEVQREASDEPVPYDLAKQERIVRGRMPTLEIINERFARNLRVGLFNFMRRSPEMSIGAIQVQKYGAFLGSIPVPTNINIVAVKPLRGNGLVICDPKLVFTIIDNMFGGAGRQQYRIEGRDFTATEHRIIQRTLDVVLEEYHKAWAGIYPLRFEYLRSEMNPQFAGIATPGEIVVTTTFKLEIGDLGGELHVCIPYSTLEPIRDILYSSLQGEAIEPDSRWMQLLTHQIKTADINLTAELGTTQATVGDILALKPGDFIELDLPETVFVKSDGVAIFECKYGLANGRYAVRIQDVLGPPPAI